MVAGRPLPQSLCPGCSLRLGSSPPSHNMASSMASFKSLIRRRLLSEALPVYLHFKYQHIPHLPDISHTSFPFYFFSLALARNILHILLIYLTYCLLLPLNTNTMRDHCLTSRNQRSTWPTGGIQLTSVK